MNVYYVYFEAMLLFVLVIMMHTLCAHVFDHICVADKYLLYQPLVRPLWATKSALSAFWVFLPWF